MSYTSGKREEVGSGSEPTKKYRYLMNGPGCETVYVNVKKLGQNNFTHKL